MTCTKTALISHACKFTGAQALANRRGLEACNWPCQTLNGCSVMQMPFEDVLPYKDFALRLPQHMIYALPEVLQGVLEDQHQVCMSTSLVLPTIAAEIPLEDPACIDAQDGNGCICRILVKHNRAACSAGGSNALATGLCAAVLQLDSRLWASSSCACMLPAYQVASCRGGARDALGRVPLGVRVSST